MVRELDFSDGFESSAAPTIGLISATSLNTYVNDAAFVTAKGSAASAGDIYHNTTSNQVREYNGSTWRDIVASEGAQTIAGDKTFSNNVIISGDLNVNGTTTTINTTTLDVTDAQITVNNGGTQASANANDAGLLVEMSDATDVMIGYDSTLTSRWKLGDVGSEVEIASVSHSQIITNKDIDGGTASNTSRITLPKASTVTLNALTRKQGTIVFDTTTGTPKYDDGAVLQPFGSTGITPQVEYRTISAGEATAEALTLASTPLSSGIVMVDAIGGCAQEYSVDYSVTGTTLSWGGLGLAGLVAGDKLRISYFS